MSNLQSVSIDPLRSIAQASITNSYQEFGAAFSEHARLVHFTNNTDGDMFISDDGVTDKIFIPANSFALYDLNTNRLNNEVYWVFPVGTQFYIKYSTAPSTGAVYLAVFWGD